MRLLRPATLPPAFTAFLLLSLVTVGPAVAKDAVTFAGKTVSLYAGGQVGGGVDVFSRTFVPYLSRYLPGRPTIVVSRDPSFVAEGAQVARSVEEALELAAGADEVFIAGGEAIYRAALPVADRIYLTRVHACFDGDTHFPAFDANDWQVVVEERHEPDEKNPYAHTFLVYERNR